MKTLHYGLFTTITLLLLVLLPPGVKGTESQRGDLTNPDAQNIQLVESDRIVGTSLLLSFITVYKYKMENENESISLVD